jgi:prevent-host-death family protein
MAQATVENLVDEVLQTQKPALIVRGGHPIAALIPIADYERFARWQTQSESRHTQQHQQLAQERAALERMKPALLRKYAEQFVAILDGQVVDADADKRALAKRVYARWGYRTLLLTQVGTKPRVIHFDSPERAHR